MRCVACTLAIALCSLDAASAAEPARTLVKLELGGVALEGTTLLTSGQQVILLSRDGRLWDFDARQARMLRKTTDRFQSYPYGTMRRRLGEEFGDRFQVSGAGHYLVVRPAGQPDLWTRRFEELYRSFQLYFSVRRFDLAEPQFPLVAVVFASREDFLRYAEADGARLPEEVNGYYSPRSNRVAMYDRGDGRDGEAWGQNAATIIHEATHQTAFNTGIHNRFASTPRWVSEGLGTMFEAPGVWNSRSFPRLADRLNRDRLESFRRYLARRKPDSLAQLISFDRAFALDAEAAYPEAWALTFFLAETRSRDYARYLRLVARRPDWQDYPAAERLRDFTGVFGENLKQLDARLLDFVERL